jgi:hypothetical protein
MKQWPNEITRFTGSHFKVVQITTLMQVIYILPNVYLVQRAWVVRAYVRVCTCVHVGCAGGFMHAVFSFLFSFFLLLFFALPFFRAFC